MKNKKNNKEKIPVKNYIKLFLIIIVTVFLILVVRNLYISSRDYELNIPIITESVISEINTDEVYHYIRENENAILYIGVASDTNCRNLEKDFNEVIKTRNLENIITYLNITKSNNKSKFIKEFNKFYDTDLLGYPSIVIFEEGEVKATLTVKTGKELTIDEVIKFLDDNEVVSDDDL
jgi:predicted bacteriocin transport accessory protein